MKTLLDKLKSDGFVACPNWRGYGQKYEKQTERGEEIIYFDTRNNREQERYFQPRKREDTSLVDITKLKEYK